VLHWSATFHSVFSLDTGKLAAVLHSPLCSIATCRSFWCLPPHALHWQRVCFFCKFSLLVSGIFLPRCPGNDTTPFTLVAFNNSELSDRIHITNFMEKSPPLEPNSHSASQEIHSLLRNPKVHYRVHRNPPLVPFLCQMHPDHILPPKFTWDLF
jgi:hypothetical protein